VYSVPHDALESGLMSGESATHNLVHFNLAIAREPLDHPVMAGFVSQVEAINQLARHAPGFVWMSEGDADDAVRLFGEPKALLNATVWRSVDALKAFTYSGQHAVALKRRSEWFVPPQGPAYVLWWITITERPTFVEAKKRLALLSQNGPTPSAFSFKVVFEAPSA
jgi:hypothetical protein